MLAFSFTDAHFHLIPCIDVQAAVFPSDAVYYGCSCAHDRDEFLRQEREMQSVASERCRIVPSFGMHPQLPLVQNAGFMEQLLKERRIAAIGEAGFDLFTQEYKRNLKAQEDAWRIQIEFARLYSVPLVVHARKATDRLFRDAPYLKQLTAVVFHSFPGSCAEAQALVRRGVNAFFSFGKPLIAGDKSARTCVAELPLDRLLFETDAPYQTLRGESATKPDDIVHVYETAARLRSSDVDRIARAAERNFKAVYGIV